MEEFKEEVKVDYFNPIRMNTLGIPQEHDILIAYDVYRPALETRALKSEQERTLYAEHFIENTKLGPLRDLCTRALTLAYTPKRLPLLAEDPLKIRLYYDSLSIDLPLEQCYDITDEKYWRRYVLAKNKDVTLAFKKDYNWRSLGLSMKFVELVEACPAEYWPIDEMEPIALKIKENINEMHIRKLQSISERFFRERLHLDDSEESESDSTDVESMTATPRSTEIITDMGLEEEQEEEEEEGADRRKSQRGTIKHVTRLTAMNVVEEVPEIFETEEQLELERIHEEITKERKERTRALREAQQKRREERLKRRPYRESIKVTTPPPIEQPATGKKKKKFRPKGVFDMIVEPAEDDGEELIVDRRNLKRQLTVRKKLHYPTRLCHHVSLRFLRFFENLVNFTIEFRGPDMQRDFHERHLKFSQADVEGLAYGVSFLQKLKIFRLRSSQMDARKLYTLAKALKSLVCIETIDFGYDHLDDDCGLGLLELFRQTNSIKSLELEHNLIGAHALHFLAIGISQFGGQLEYLGLGGNPLGDCGLHELSTKVVDTQHITNLSLSTSQITETAIRCCIANEFLNHPRLRSLDMRAVPISEQAAIEILQTLQSNTTILKFDVRDCRLDADLELDIEIILKRNKYISENPYLNDLSKTMDEIDEFVKRIKNPILLRAIEAVEKRAECLKNRPPEFRPISAEPVGEPPSSPTQGSVSSLYEIIAKSEMKPHRMSLPSLTRIHRTCVSTGSWGKILLF
ncbi:uncharacterized protein LOC101462004 isoform X4 [Ceratitis capitata]|uniref:uncharacterized protein LOC101462004 isoform X4 n=1 Tax=Ceratitis capitata TaxID=7213 RepID=UPI0006188FAD|nr:uncharacterized protein LOC101462004 isoform X4 [Ceratitis capitata]XP_020716275.1 uncharacterized protein LOC101462004 isoform X4 [Ceratitis capitata]